MTTEVQAALVQLEVDGQTVAVPEGSTLLEAIRALGKDVPTLCYHPVLEPIGVCRICVVEVEGSRTLVPACIRKVEPGMRVRTDTPRVRLSRRMVAELLQSSVDTSLAPDVQRYAEEYGARPERWARFRPEGPPRPRAPKVDNELYVRDLDRCILCYRCVRVCGEEVQNSFAIAVAGRGLEARIDPGFDLPLPESACVFCGNCVAVCPTEALVPKTQFEMRRAGTWDETRQRVVTTVCPYCGVGCNLELHVQDDRIVKVTAPPDDPITRGFLCIKGRFGWTYVHAGVDPKPEMKTP
ncbi:MAG: 2Fe-2S iron-sulfur cluster-binding protein [Armatimonadota bacterium]|nr:2Fe-2S iron-sulfur cluster-binding protein [Armatimonadota bacterium]MDR7444668.1 2Fe-2S iron-sulfur cluster-binding protein [Armatimonadota bacterium]MDR7569494.1 2Fe-2S iron-sulfur cluster-binding protein [Armatimonadota bacterium]MDR7613623.1 2Fe-2S iron-sulfur cluster-binding protein [Armatimonadota bacterium]